MEEKDLYPDMVEWLDNYIKDKYPEYKVKTIDSSQITLEAALRELGLSYSMINGLDIQIDVLGTASKKDELLLFFIEAKKGTLKLNDLGQLLLYSKLAQPEEAYLMTPGSLGAVQKVIDVLNRTELLEYSNGEKSKMISIVQWNTVSKGPNWNSKLPRRTTYELPKTKDLKVAQDSSPFD